MITLLIALFKNVCVVFMPIMKRISDIWLLGLYKLIKFTIVHLYVINYFTGIFSYLYIHLYNIYRCISLPLLKSVLIELSIVGIIAPFILYFIKYGDTNYLNFLITELSNYLGVNLLDWFRRPEVIEDVNKSCFPELMPDEVIEDNKADLSSDGEGRFDRRDLLRIVCGIYLLGYFFYCTEYFF